MKVAINGAGIAGTALAYWLSQMGHDVAWGGTAMTGVAKAAPSCKLRSPLS